MKKVIVIGGGLAGCEAAWQAASRGAKVTLYEMKPKKYSEAHKESGLAELVCSNSLRSNDPGSAPGLLKEEMRMLGSLLMDAAEAAKVPAGSALAVDRAVFSDFVTSAIEANNNITIVSGLPRSGTSMMMKMLEAGGLEAVTDEIRKADEDNPKGYYEFEKVKKIKEDSSWLEDVKGKVVKMVSMLLYDLPSDYSYKIIFMRREMNEILASQTKMLGRKGKSKGKTSRRRKG